MDQLNMKSTLKNWIKSVKLTFDRKLPSWKNLIIIFGRLLLCSQNVFQINITPLIFHFIVLSNDKRGYIDFPQSSMWIYWVICTGSQIKFTNFQPAGFELILAIHKTQNKLVVWKVPFHYTEAITTHNIHLIFFYTKCSGNTSCRCSCHTQNI